PSQLRRPIIVVANYLFDTIPQEMFYAHAGKCEQCLVTLSLDEDPAGLDATELLAKLQVAYERQPLAKPPYAEPYLAQILPQYHRDLKDTHFLFPATALRCLQRLKALSKRGLMVISADKGDQHLIDLEGKAAPEPVRHGSFSLLVNYHALKTFCEQSGGL